ADGELALWVPDRDVGVRPDRDCSLARIEAVDLGMVGRAECDETVEIDAALDDAFGKKDRQPRRHAWNAVRHPAKTGASLRRQLALRIVVAERTVIGGKDRKHLLLKSFPARFLAGLIAR